MKVLIPKRKIQIILLVMMALLVAADPSFLLAADGENLSMQISVWREAWRQAWEKAELEAYLAFYRDDALQEQRRGKKSILRHKKKIWQKQPPVRVICGPPDIYATSRGLEVVFFMEYTNRGGFSDHGFKTLVLTEEKSGAPKWRIAEEKWQVQRPIPPLKFKAGAKQTGTEKGSPANDAPAGAAQKRSDNHAELKQDIMKWREAWRQAWEKAELEAYLAFYRDDALQEQRRGKKSILRHKKKIWQKQPPVRVICGPPDIYATSRGLEVVFFMEYAGRGGFSDHGFKTLVLTEEKSGAPQWRIAVEEWSAKRLPPPAEDSVLKGDGWGRLAEEQATQDIPDQEASAVSVAPQEEATEAPSGEGDADERQLDVIEARIASRMGDYERSLSLYSSLRRQYPADRYIWEDLVETLVDNWDYEWSLAELAGMKKEAPLSPRAARLKARVYIETKSFERALEIIEEVKAENPRNAGVLADDAYIRSSLGDAAGALYYYSDVLDADRDNESVRDASFQLLRELRPRMDTGFRIEWKAGDTSVQGVSAGFGATVDRRGNVFAALKHTTVSRPSGGTGVREIKEDLTEGLLKIRWPFGERWFGSASAGGYSGLNGGVMAGAGLAYEYFNRLKFRMDYEYHLPWYDPVEAAAYQGSQNRAFASAEWIYRDRWFFNASVEDIQYRLNGYEPANGDYGNKIGVMAGLSRKISIKPELYVGYSFYLSRFSYARD
ncbi:MAG TPA: hypothetical protein PLC82_08920, partial [Smithellaceae bacterium]|nr:hypothetical protein [Smithellaceae bacterium]